MASQSKCGVSQSDIRNGLTNIVNSSACFVSYFCCGALSLLRITLFGFQRFMLVHGSFFSVLIVFFYLFKKTSFRLNTRALTWICSSCFFIAGLTGRAGYNNACSGEEFGAVMDRS